MGLWTENRGKKTFCPTTSFPGGQLFSTEREFPFEGTA